MQTKHCQTCTNPIHPGRLRADPNTVLCLECAIKAERAKVSQTRIGERNEEA